MIIDITIRGLAFVMAFVGVLITIWAIANFKKYLPIALLGIVLILLGYVILFPSDFGFANFNPVTDTCTEWEVNQDYYAGCMNECGILQTYAEYRDGIKLDCNKRCSDVTHSSDESTAAKYFRCVSWRSKSECEKGNTNYFEENIAYLITVNSEGEYQRYDCLGGCVRGKMYIGVGKETSQKKKGIFNETVCRLKNEEEKAEDYCKANPTDEVNCTCEKTEKQFIGEWTYNATFLPTIINQLKDEIIHNCNNFKSPENYQECEKVYEPICVSARPKYDCGNPKNKCDSNYCNYCKCINARFEVRDSNKTSQYDATLLEARG
jgi:hypothetical protein